jgi:hypothetical protein
MVRWWDGQRWTNDARPSGTGPGGAAWGWGIGPDLATDLAEEAKTGRAASVALVGGAIAYTAQHLVGAFQFGGIWRDLRRQLDAPLRSDGSRAPLVLSHKYTALNVLSPLISIAVLAVGVLFLIWFYNAATIAARAGIPARRSPGWAIGGWFVPIVNFWFPYQSAVDFFPSGHPDRKKVKRWWAWWLVTSSSGILVLIGSFVSTGVGLAFAVLAAGSAFAAAWAGRQVIDGVNRVHAGLMGR